MEQVAEVHEVIVVGEGGEVHPHTVQRAAVVLAVSPYIKGGMSAVVVVIVEFLFFLQLFQKFFVEHNF